jgi:hypothetical protein
VKIKTSFFTPIISPFFLFIAIAITTICVTILIFRFTTTFITTDQPANLHYLSTQTIKDLHGSPAIVNVGLRINNFEQFDMVKDSFTFDGILSFKFNPNQISLETVKNFSFKHGKILSISPPTTTITDNMLTARYDIQIQFTNYINSKYFPLDDHLISIILVQKDVSPGELIYDANNEDFIIGQDMNFIGWHNVGQNVETGYIEERLNQFDSTKTLYRPTAVFSIQYGRKGSIRNTMTIVFPLLALFFISLFSLILERRSGFDSGAIVELSSSSIIGLIAYRFVMEELSPKVGYFLYADYIYYFLLSLTFLVLIANLLDSYLTVFLKKALIITLCTAIILFFLWLLWF